MIQHKHLFCRTSEISAALSDLHCENIADVGIWTYGGRSKERLEKIT